MTYFLPPHVPTPVLTQKEREAWTAEIDLAKDNTTINAIIAKLRPYELDNKDPLKEHLIAKWYGISMALINKDDMAKGWGRSLSTLFKERT